MKQALAESRCLFLSYWQEPVRGRDMIGYGAGAGFQLIQTISRVQDTGSYWNCGSVNPR